MAAKSVIIVFKEDRLIQNYWTNLKECTKDLNLQYWTIARLKSPISYKEYKIYRLPIKNINGK